MNNGMTLIDLTHTIHEEIPLWPGSRIFSNEICQNYSPGQFRINNYHLCAGTGTHLDAPFHAEKDGKSVSDFTLQELIGPGCVIDVTRSANQNPDYAITVDDLEQWEKIHGVIPKKAIVLAHTGWARFWDQPSRYCNADDEGILHFPGFSEKAAQWLIKREIIGVGIDTLSLDPGDSQTYPAHHIFLGQGLFQLENVANLAAMPATGATIFVLPLKIRNGPEAPARVFAMLSEAS